MSAVDLAGSFKTAFEAIRKQGKMTHAGVALTAAAILDNSLERVLRGTMISLPKKLDYRLFDNFGPLSNFAGKILMARALDIVTSEVFEELEKIRRIRNTFAHTSKSLDFESEEVAPQLLALRKRLAPKKAALDQFMDCVSAIDEFLDAKQKADPAVIGKGH
jgi:DNA-binding MltR family transcriptional regulator